MSISMKNMRVVQGVSQTLCPKLLHSPAYHSAKILLPTPPQETHRGFSMIRIGLPAFFCAQSQREALRKWNTSK